MLAREDIRHLYRRRAGWYDLSANAYYVIGFASGHTAAGPYARSVRNREPRFSSWGAGRVSTSN